MKPELVEEILEDLNYRARLDLMKIRLGKRNSKYVSKVVARLVDDPKFLDLILFYDRMDEKELQTLGLYFGGAVNKAVNNVLSDTQ